MNTEVWLLPAALVAFGAVAQFSHWYGRDWQPPAGSESSNWTLRRNLGLGLGALTVLIAAVASLIFVHDSLARIFIVGQAVLLAASGASDVRKFHLPLPITLAGVALAIATVVALKTSLLIVAFGLIWAMVLIVLFALATRRAMALGDYIAAVWIALAAPFNGLLAVIAGDVANFVYVRVTGQHTDRKAKLAAAGPWLLFAAALIALPPFMVWPSRLTQIAAAHAETTLTVSTPSSLPGAQGEQLVSESDQLKTAPLAAQDTESEAARVRVTLWLAKRVGDATATVAFEQDHAGRMSRAKEVAGELANYELLAGQFGTGAMFKSILHDLRLALASYDVEAVRAASSRLAEAQTALNIQLALLTTPAADLITDTVDALPDAPAPTSIETTSETTSTSSTQN